MNIFYLHKDPQQCARLHCDKHVVKMIIEYAQLLSTTHRVLDGELFFDKAKNGRKLRRFKLPDERLKRESNLQEDITELKNDLNKKDEELEKIEIPQDIIDKISDSEDSSEDSDSVDPNNKTD